jgi:branched-chain amino acid aminotransferase
MNETGAAARPAAVDAAPSAAGGTAPPEADGTAPPATGGTAPPPAFGTVLAATMATCVADGGVFGPVGLGPVTTLSLHPAAHVLHYGSACFEGLKAHRGDDGTVRLFRLGRHVERLRSSAELLCLPVPDRDLLATAITEVVVANLDAVPSAPGALYLRPVLLGTEANIGAAATPSTDALLYVLASPVGEYFRGDGAGLRLAIETELPRTTPQFGRAKSGANYAMALGVTRRARAEHGADQVLFAPGGDVQETGAANFLLLDDDRVVTKALDGSFLHGVTRDSVLTIARDLGYEVEERDLDVDEVPRWADRGEAALAGTAAVLAGVGTFVHRGREVTVGDGQPGRNTRRLRDALTAVQRGEVEDPHGWTTAVGTALPAAP